ncbi:protein ALTERED XYLOGLUCAN 4-like [Vigna radiata var. radiata]|uniref:Protein ALTERED XYLOGLUCAN 4-like n=1 Tax=Vigna radiata var. radiata TaxID=3916 RepID=A0A1S3TFI2_VIGRR|nr:protein ALTERED XYLOGLUCAN 4-like [Vigna radiata var. radiata]
MKGANSIKDQSLSNRLLPCTLHILLPIPLLPMIFLSVYFHPFSLAPSPSTKLLPPPSSSTSTPLPPSAVLADKDKDYVCDTPCDYSNGRWVGDKTDPLYNGTTCSTIKESQNCMINGRQDSSYLYWRWKPYQCHLPRFEPNTFLQLITNKHLAFVGDSLARNQIESLLCLLATVSAPKRVHHKGSRRWHFASHNASLSLYWSPFLVQGVQRSNTGPLHNIIHLDRNEKWTKDVDEMDLIVLSVGNWFLVPSVYYEGGKVLGCLNCEGLEYSDIGFYGPLRKALRATLDRIIEKKVGKGNGVNVIVRTFSPSHFEGDWDKEGSCPKTRPYIKGEMKLGEVDEEIRRIEMEEVENAKVKAKEFRGFSFETLDVTKLSWLRPDGHPGAYMNHFPLGNGVSGRVQNDCVHWCLPGPIDSWNEILLEMIKTQHCRLSLFNLSH